MDPQAAKFIGAGIACIALVGAGIGIGNVFGSYLSGALRNPRRRSDPDHQSVARLRAVRSNGPVRPRHRASHSVRVLRRAAATTATIEAPAHKGAGFPPFRTETFPGQIFWLVITFAFLFVVLWRVAGPRIKGVISARRGRINDDLTEAQDARRAAEDADAAYQTALAEARARAHALAEETRNKLNNEIALAKSAADAAAHAAMAAADSRIAATRQKAKAHVSEAAAEAAVAIVARLIGEKIAPGEAAAVIRAASGG